MKLRDVAKEMWVKLLFEPCRVRNKAGWRCMFFPEVGIYADSKSRTLLAATNGHGVTVQEAAEDYARKLRGKHAYRYAGNDVDRSMDISSDLTV